MGQSITTAGEMELAVPRDEKSQGLWGAGREKTQNRGRSLSMCSVGSAWWARDAESSGAKAGPGGLGNLFPTLCMSAMRVLWYVSLKVAQRFCICPALLPHRGSCKIVHGMGHVQACCLSHDHKGFTNPQYLGRVL